MTFDDGSRFFAGETILAMQPAHYVLNYQHYFRTGTGEVKGGWYQSRDLPFQVAP